MYVGLGLGYSCLWLRECTINHPVRKSILGRVATAASLEVLGGILGAYLGRSLLGAALPQAALFVGGEAFLNKMSCKTALVAAAFVGASAAFPGFGVWFGSQIGMILGGYAGLIAAESKVPFWDHTISCDSYLVGMGKYVIAGEIFERVITRAEIPYLHLPLNVIRASIASVIKTCSYHSSAALHIFKSLLREKEFNSEVILPLIVKVSVGKYCDQSPNPLSSKIIQILMQSFRDFPSIAKQFRFFISPLIQSQPFQKILKEFPKNSDRWTMALMRGFSEYVDFVKKHRTQKDLKTALNNKIWGSSPLYWVFSSFCDRNIPLKAHSLLQTLQEMETDLFGLPLLSEPEKIEPLLAMHMECFIGFFLHNYNFSPLSAEEERDFFQKLAESFFSIYKRGSFALKGVQVGILALFFFKMHIRHLLEQPDERAVALSCIKAKEGYLPSPATTPEPDDGFFVVEDDHKRS